MLLGIAEHARDRIGMIEHDLEWLVAADAIVDPLLGALCDAVAFRQRDELEGSAVQEAQRERAALVARRSAQ